MNVHQVQQAKRSVAKVLGVHRSFNYKEPYNKYEDVEFGGTAFFVDPKIFGRKFPIRVGKKRFALTNFHVVDELVEKKCYICYPEKGMSQITASVVFVVPKLDVAILMVDPDATHPLWFDNQDIGDFIKSIPNLDICNHPIKGNSQNVVAIGFPNLSSDYQLCEGCISGRGHEMIQLSISLNGGNSGGPLLMNGRAIGICTASVADSEALGLAVPIHQTLRFFKYWTNFEGIILQTPSWGMNVVTTTPEYLEYFDVDTTLEGSSVQKIKTNGPIEHANITKDDIILSIQSGHNKYKIDNFGLVAVDWTDKRVSIGNTEFILSLDPKNIKFNVFKWETKSYKTVKVCPTAIKYEIRETYHAWEHIPYCILGGIVFMNLSTHHFDYDEEDEEESNQVSPLIQYSQSNMCSKNAVIVTHIPAQTQVASQKVLSTFDRIVKCNQQDVRDVKHLERIIQRAVKTYNARGSANVERFIVLETAKNKVYLDLENLQKREIIDSQNDRYSKKKCKLLSLKKKRRRNKRKQ